MRFLLLIVLFIFLLPAQLNAQSKYNFDYNKRVNSSWFSRLFVKNKEPKLNPCPKPDRKVERESNKVRRKHYSRQTKEVKRRMKNNEKKADRFNNGKTPFWVKIKAKFNGSVF